MSDSIVLVGVAGAGLAAAGLAAVVVPPTRRLGARVRPYTVVTRARLREGADAADVVPDRRLPGGVSRVVAAPVVAALERVGRTFEQRSDAAIALALRQAGFVDVTADDYRVRTALHVVAAGGAGALIGAVLLHRSLFALGLAACGVAFGATRLRGRLDRAMAERRERIRLELYTVNQLLAIHVRTGAGPVQATQRVVDRARGVVVGELGAALGEMRRGVSEPVAFRHAAELTPEPAAARTYKLFAAGAERGVDLADGLRALSEDLRDARREEVRQLATRRRAAMLVPTIAVLAPVMLLFIAAPLPSIVFGSA